MARPPKTGSKETFYYAPFPAARGKAAGRIGESGSLILEKMLWPFFPRSRAAKAI
jgi:hypothetical protein